MTPYTNMSVLGITGIRERSRWGKTPTAMCPQLTKQVRQTLIVQTEGSIELWFTAFPHKKDEQQHMVQYSSWANSPNRVVYDTSHRT